MSERHETKLPPYEGTANDDGVLFVVRYHPDHQRIMVLDGDGYTIVEPGWFDKATTGEFVAYVADAMLRSMHDDGGITEPHDVTYDYREASDVLATRELDARLADLEETASE